MKLRDYLIGVILGAMLIASFSVMITDLGTDYNVTTTDFNATYNRMDDIQDVSEDIKGDLDNETIDITSFWGLALAPFRALKLVLTSASVLQEMIFDFGEEFGIPNWFLWGVATILLITIMFVIISVIFKRST